MLKDIAMTIKHCASCQRRKNPTHTTVRTIVDRVIARQGVSENLVTDQGSNFTSHLFKNAMKLLGINHSMSTPYHHQCDNWDENLQLITHAYNSSESSITQNSPFYLTYGRQPNSPFTTAIQAPVRQYRDEDDYIAQLTEDLQTAWRLNNKIIEDQKKRYDLRNHARASNAFPACSAKTL
uniref:Integrase catalytic domain-containing protein n=1 Tax=Heterorhabditis bacteriophora TaxID=37862 RepID=A0A1I7W778_HETBA